MPAELSDDYSGSSTEISSDEKTSIMYNIFWPRKLIWRDTHTNSPH